MVKKLQNHRISGAHVNPPIDLEKLMYVNPGDWPKPEKKLFFSRPTDPQMTSAEWPHKAFLLASIMSAWALQDEYRHNFPLTTAIEDVTRLNPYHDTLVVHFGGFLATKVACTANFEVGKQLQKQVEDYLQTLELSQAEFWALEFEFAIDGVGQTATLTVKREGQDLTKFELRLDERGLII